MNVTRWLRWRSDTELREEIQAHLEMEIQANLDRGFSPEQARVAAQRRFGNATLVSERVREADPLFSLEILVGPDISVMSYVVRSSPPPLGLTPAVRRTIEEVDATVAMARLETLQDAIDRTAEQAAFTMVLLALAAGVALLLGLVGIYGVVSYIVTQRTAEIGVRLALGAEPGSVTAMIVRQGGIVALAGVLAGLAAALVGGRLIASLLYGVSPRDPAVFAATAITLLGVVTLACWLPARRAARISPVEALRPA